MTSNQQLAVGMMAPEIELPGVDGAIYRLSDLRGKGVLVTFLSHAA
jgi:peroxiredoxin